MFFRTLLYSVQTYDVARVVVTGCDVRMARLRRELAAAVLVRPWWFLFFFVISDRLLGDGDILMVTVLCVLLPRLFFSATVPPLMVISAYDHAFDSVRLCRPY